jgi:flagellar basal body-associated protein FliL
MKSQKGISSLDGIIIIIVIAVIAFGGIFAYQYFVTKTQPVIQTQQNQNTENKTPIIEGISIEKPNLIVTGQNLSKVKIYFVPTGTQIDPETMSKIEDAVKQSENNGEQVWTYRYPSDLLITNIFAKGFDDKGNLVKEVDLPIVGASALADALYGSAVDQTAGWKTYTNSQYGFSFNYPANPIDPVVGKDSVGVGCSVDSNNGTTGCSMIVDMPKIFTNGTTGQPRTFSDMVNSYGSNGYTKTTVMIGGIQSFEVSSSQIGSIVLVPLSDNRILEISGSSNNPIFNQMLSTFKFTK